MKTSRIVAAAALLVFLAAASASALEIKNGRIRLVLSESTGRFSIYYLSDMTKGSYTPLLWDQDPRTTYMSILVGNTVYRMGDSFDFKQQVKSTDSGGQIIWTSRSLTVTEDFSFLASANSPVVNGVKLTITVANTSEQDLNVGVRYLFDTYLGEKSHTPFVTDVAPSITSELELDPPSLPKWWASSADAAKSVAFEAMTQGNGVTQPDRLIFANWKRLNDSSWSFTSNNSRDFDLLPYSVNDSAACMYYNPTAVKRGTSREIDVFFGNWVAEGFAANPQAAQTSSSIAAIFNSTVASPSTTASSSPATIHDSVQSDLLTVQDLITQIDQKLASSTPPSDADIQILQQVIDKLQQRKSAYEQQQ